MTSDGPRDPVTSLDLETKAEYRRRAAEVEPGGRWSKGALGDDGTTVPGEAEGARIQGGANWLTVQGGAEGLEG